MKIIRVCCSPMSSVEVTAPAAARQKIGMESFIFTDGCMVVEL